MIKTLLIVSSVLIFLGLLIVLSKFISFSNIFMPKTNQAKIKLKQEKIEPNAVFSDFIFSDEKKYIVTINHPEHGLFLINNQDYIKANLKNFKLKASWLSYLPGENKRALGVSIFENNVQIKDTISSMFSVFDIGDAFKYKAPVKHVELLVDHKNYKTKYLELIKDPSVIFLTYPGQYDFKNYDSKFDHTTSIVLSRIDSASENIDLETLKGSALQLITDKIKPENFFASTSVGRINHHGDHNLGESNQSESSSNKIGGWDIQDKYHNNLDDIKPTTILTPFNSESVKIFEAVITITASKETCLLILKDFKKFKWHTDESAISLFKQELKNQLENKITKSDDLNKFIQNEVDDILTNRYYDILSIDHQFSYFQKE